MVMKKHLLRMLTLKVMPKCIIYLDKAPMGMLSSLIVNYTTNTCPWLLLLMPLICLIRKTISWNSPAKARPAVMECHTVTSNTKQSNQHYLNPNTIMLP